MKNLIVTLATIILLFATLTFAKAQNTFTLSELEKLCDYKYDDFETYVLTKGYSISNATSDEFDKMFSSDIPESNGMNDYISITNAGLARAFVVLTSTSKASYLQFKIALADNGFKQVKEIPSPVKNKFSSCSSWCYYSDGKYTLLLYSYTNPDGTIWYSQDVSKN